MHAGFRRRHPLFVGANAGGAFDQRCRELAPVFGEHLVFRGELLLGLGRLLLLRARLLALAQRRHQHACGKLHRAVTGAWRHEGGGAFHNNGDLFHLNKTLIEGSDLRDPSIRMLDQSRIGPILTGDEEALQGGGPVTALFIQNTNPVSVAPEQEVVKRGFARDDLFVCVHEQFMTDTAKVADIVLPATMFVEHDDFYTAGGSQYILLGPKLIEPPGECRSNHEVIGALARRLGAEHPGFAMTERELIDATLQKSGWGTLADLEANRWIDCQPDFATAHYLNGFAYPDGKFRFKPDWPKVPFGRWHRNVPSRPIPSLPDHWDVIEEADAEHPFRLATSPARGFLNSTFTETPTSINREQRPTVMINPDDAAALGVADGEKVVLGNRRGEVRLHAKLFDGLRRGVLIAESVWPNSAYADGRGINTLTGADSIAPYGGAAFHDNKVWLRKLGELITASLLLVRHRRRDVIELLASGRGHDHRAADIDPVRADAGIGLEGEHHAGLQDRLAHPRRVGAGVAHVELDLILIDQGAAGEKMRADRVQQRRIAPASGRLQRLLHHCQQIGEGDAGFERLDAGGIGLERDLFALLIGVVERIERHRHLHLDFLVAAQRHQLGLHQVAALQDARRLAAGGPARRAPR